MRIAVVGSGISGLAAAHLLSRAHEVTLFERDARVGGHTHTHRVRHEGRDVAVDTGFIVFNHRTYPNFTKLMARLGVATQESDMSFSVRDERTGLEWCGTSWNTIFAWRRNALRPSFLRMLRDIARFHGEARALLEPGPEVSFGEWLARGRWSREFKEHYLFPMCAAIWSGSTADVPSFPARNFARFFDNHGMLTVDDRPVWRTITGGSASYLAPLTAPFRDRIRASSPVERVQRLEDAVLVTVRGREPERFDHVVIAAHADQALAMLADPDRAEREVLGAIPYRPNRAVLHRDRSLMPRRERACASWNYHLGASPAAAPLVTYDMERLQRLGTRERLYVTLNRDGDIDPSKVLAAADYEHPAYTSAATAAQARWGEVNGRRRTWFAGAWWGWGFHEDGMRSALAVTRGFGIEL